MEYPLNVYPSVYSADISQANKTISDLSYSHAWQNLIEEIKKHPGMVNTCRFPTDSSTPAKLFTPVHQAAHGRASKEVFEELIQLGASRTLKTGEGETAHDIAKRFGMSEEILNLIQVPKEVRKNYEEIQTMEAGLHKVIRGRAEHLIIENGQALPQLAFLYEFGNFWYPVPGMYGSFSVSKHKKGIEVTSFCRVVGGSGQLHVIDRKGNVKLKKEGFY